MFLRSSHDVGLVGVLVMVRAAAVWGTCVAGVPFCDIETAGEIVILIVPATRCAGSWFLQTLLGSPWFSVVGAGATGICAATGAVFWG